METEMLQDNMRYVKQQFHGRTTHINSCNLSYELKTLYWFLCVTMQKVLIVCMSTIFSRLDARTKTSMQMHAQKQVCNECESYCNVCNSSCESKKSISQSVEEWSDTNCKRDINDSIFIVYCACTCNFVNIYI